MLTLLCNKKQFKTLIIFFRMPRLKKLSLISDGHNIYSNFIYFCQTLNYESFILLRTRKLIIQKNNRTILSFQHLTIIIKIIIENL
jgi:hypothetical protein